MVIVASSPSTSNILRIALLLHILANDLSSSSPTTSRTRIQDEFPFTGISILSPFSSICSNNLLFTNTSPTISSGFSKRYGTHIPIISSRYPIFPLMSYAGNTNLTPLKQVAWTLSSTSMSLHSPSDKIIGCCSSLLTNFALIFNPIRLFLLVFTLSESNVLFQIICNNQQWMN